jgi:type IV pilus assembly protein PilM
MNNFGKILRNTLTIKFDKAFGLDISDRSIEIIELEKVFKFSVVTYGRAELPDGIIEDGRILNQAILAEKLKKLLKEVKPQKVSTNKAIVSLPESQVFVQCFTVEANLKSSALSKVIVDKASLSLPINIDKTYWDFIEKPLDDKTKKLIIFISVPKEIADSYVAFCNSIGLEVVSLCTESLSLARTILKSSSKQSLIIDIGSRTTNLSFFDSDDKMNMSVIIPVAGEQMTETVKERLNMDYLEAEDLKVKFGFKESAENKVKPIILPILEDILLETKAAINYYEETFKQKLDDIYIIGGSALLPGITEAIKGYLKKEVQVATNGSNIILGSLSGKNNPFPLYANVVGLGMLGASGEFRDMNMLKKMPSNSVNSINRLNLFSMGYLSKVNTVRTIINNKYVLVMMIILIGVIFAVLLQQTKNFGLDNSDIKPTGVIKPKVLPRIGTSTLPRLSSTTPPFPIISSSTRNNAN